MKFPSIVVLGALLSASSVCGAPAPVTDTSILQYALNLEYLEHTFYAEGLKKFSAQTFADAGYEAWVRGRFTQIRNIEESHVRFLQKALGSAAPAVCNYSFPYTDVQSWASLSQTFEHVGAAAYLGAARYVSNKDTLSAALAISHIEARQAGWVNSAILKLQPWDGDFETALYFSGVWSLVSPFVTSCPSTNPLLPVNTFPALTIPNESPPQGSNITISYDGCADAKGPTYMAWYHDMTTTFTEVDASGVTTVPDGLQGTVYAGVVSNKTITTGDTTMLSGLAIFSFPFSSYGYVSM